MVIHAAYLCCYLSLTGIWIRADEDITVYGYNIGEWSSDTFLALPVTLLGSEYRVVSMTSSEHQGAPPSQMAIVATRLGLLV